MYVRAFLAAPVSCWIPSRSESQVSKPERAWRDLGARSAGDEFARARQPESRSLSQLRDPARRRARSALAATHSGDSGSAASRVELTLPRPDGRLERFRVVESPVLATRDAADVAGHSHLCGPGNRRSDGIRPHRPDAPRTACVRAHLRGHLCHRSADSRTHRSRHEPLEPRRVRPRRAVRVQGCRDAQTSSNREFVRSAVSTPAGDTLRTYRFTLTTPGEYTQFFGGDTLVALAQMVTVVNRVNGAYERDLAIHLNAVWLKAFPDPAHRSLPRTTTIPTTRLWSTRSWGPPTTTWASPSTRSSALGHSGVGGSVRRSATTGRKAETFIQSGNPVDLTTYRIVMHEMGHNFDSLPRLGRSL